MKNASSVSYCYDRHFLVFTYSTTYQRPLFGRTPYTGFEPASLLQPTIFKTAPSPPGHTAFLYVPINHRLFSENAGNPLHALPRMYVVFAVLRLYVSALFPDFQPKHRPSADRQRNLTEAQCVGFEPTRRTNARRLSKPFQYHYGNTAELTRCTRSKATKRIGIFSSVLSELLLLYFLLTACLLCVSFITTSHTPVKEYVRPIVGIAGIEPATTRI